MGSKVYYDLLDVKTNKLILKGGTKELASYLGLSSTTVKSRFYAKKPFGGFMIKKSKNQTPDKKERKFVKGNNIKIGTQIYKITGIDYDNVIAVKRGDESFVVDKATMQIVDENPSVHSRNSAIAKGNSNRR